jgi:hypothetical protein
LVSILDGTSAWRKEKEKRREINPRILSKRRNRNVRKDI